MNTSDNKINVNSQAFKDLFMSGNGQVNMNNKTCYSTMKNVNQKVAQQVAQNMNANMICDCTCSMVTDEVNAVERFSINSQDKTNINETIFFESSVLSKGTAINYNSTTGGFEISQTGLYEVGYKCNANKFDISTPDLALGIVLDSSVLLINSVIQHYVEDTFTVVPLSNTILIDVQFLPTSISLVTVNMYGRYRLANMYVRKVG